MSVRQTLRAVILMTVALFSPLALSAVVAIAPGPGIAVGSGGITTASSFVGTFSAGSFNSHFTTGIGGTPVTMPATMRMASNAGTFAATAVRGTPGLIGPAVAAWLLMAGIEWLSDQWMKTEDVTVANSGSTLVICNGYGQVTAVQCLSRATSSKHNDSLVDTFTQISVSSTQVVGYNTYIGGWFNALITPVCTGGTVWNGSQCAGTQTRPATDADWANVPQPLPDPAAEELAKKGLPLPLGNPEYNPAHHDVPMGDPYVDPADNIRKRDQARVTPQSDGKTARVDVVKTPVNPDGTPVNDPNGNPVPSTPDTNPDPCTINPDRLGCLNADTPDAPDITENDKTISITPQGGFGADTATCPADKSYSLRLMGNVALSWEPACQVASGMRLIVIAMAWVSAILIAIGITKRYG